MNPILPGCTIGVLGSGQLGRMFAIAARRMGYRVHTFSPDEDTPTGQVSDLEITAAYDDLDAVCAFASQVQVVTFEFENVPTATAQAAERCAPVRPSGGILHITQQRIREKRFLSAAGLPLTKYREVLKREDLDGAVHEIGLPAVLKSAAFGYDGKGQFLLRSNDQLEEAWAAVGGSESVLEAFIDFEREISVVAGRGIDGTFVHYGAVENQHSRRILDVTIAPARIRPQLA
ncbi:MAG: ATP-grasp domain-containing protein, partial [Acidobacteriaceae bacterium]|nr:ATP-grasp domain-containing protein [Acidobacteriaceae bacterium]